MGRSRAAPKFCVDPLCARVGPSARVYPWYLCQRRLGLTVILIERCSRKYPSFQHGIPARIFAISFLSRSIPHLRDFFLPSTVRKSFLVSFVQLSRSSRKFSKISTPSIHIHDYSYNYLARIESILGNSKLELSSKIQLKRFWCILGFLGLRMIE